MFYEAKAKVTRTQENGLEKEVNEHYILNDCESFTEAESRMGEHLAADNVDYDVFAISRSKVIEIVKPQEEDEPYFKATVTETIIDDKGKEKEQKYFLLVAARDIREANILMEKHLSQGLSDMVLDGIVKTKIIELI